LSLSQRTAAVSLLFRCGELIQFSHFVAVGLEEFFFWLYVYQDFGDPIDLRQDTIPDDVRDFVSCPNAQVSAHHYVKIDVVPEPDLAYKTLFEANNPGHGRRYLSDMAFNAGRRSGVQEFGHGSTELTLGAK
jgi:hypothetical protein